MRVTFVSNYINHHQIPFCEAMRKNLGNDFVFIQTEEMEEERVKMGWDNEVKLPYVVKLYEDRTRAEAHIADSDVVISGWAPEADELVAKRLEAGRLTFRISERIYKDGQWKFISPRGLVAKHRQYTRFADKPYYLLSAGAYVGSDFSLVHAFPGKKFRWGYFPPLRHYDMGALRSRKEAANRECTQLIWAGRFVDFKHVETVIRLVKDLAAHGESFHLRLVGSGDQLEELEREISKAGLDGRVTFYGFLRPEKVRDLMEESRIFIFTSDKGEGWGAVVNEAMNSGCAVIAGAEAGAVPFLIRNGVNGYIYNRTDYDELYRKTAHLINDRQQQDRFGEAGLRTVTQTWNAETAADRLIKVSTQLLAGKKPEEIDLPLDGPMSLDPCIKPYLNVPTL